MVTVVADKLQIGSKIITSVNSEGSNNLDSELITGSAMQAHVAAEIAAAEIGSGTGNILTKWKNFVALGGVANGTSSGGTDNSAALQAAHNAASDGDTILMQGNFRFNSPVVWTKRVHIWHDGSIFTGTSTFLIVDGANAKFTFNGSINGKNITSVADLTGLASAGVYFRNGVNNMLDVNIISGYQDAIRIGGYVTGSDRGLGAQYNQIRFNRLYRNYRGIHYNVTGTTTDPWKSWGNSCYFFGGEISCVEGIRFTKGPEQTDPNNQSHFYNINFEHNGFYPSQMTYGIVGEFMKFNNFYGCRFEGNKVATKVMLDSSCTSNSFFGTITFFETDLANLGHSCLIDGPIYHSVDQRVIGHRAITNTPITGSSQNLRTRIYANRRIGAMATGVPANVDIIFEKDTTATATAGTYTVPYGITHVISNSTGTNTITIPTASVPIDEKILITQIHANGSCTVNGFNLASQYSWVELKNVNGTLLFAGGKW